MKSSLLEKQINEAKLNFNYFFMMMISKIIKNILILTCFLLINQIFDTLTINIITLLYTIYSIFSIYKVIDDYNYILNDIKNTFEDEEFVYIIDTNIIKDNLVRSVVKYGK